MQSLKGSAPAKNQSLASVTKARRPGFFIEQARKLFRSIDVSTLVGLRDRVTVVTDLLNHNVPLEDGQYLAGHSSPAATAHL